MISTRRVSVFSEVYLPGSKFQSQILNHNNIKDKQGNLIEMLNDLLFFEYQIEAYANKQIKLCDHLIKIKRKNIIMVQEALAKGLHVFLEHDFQFNKNVLLAKSVFNWNNNTFDLAIHEKSIFQTKGEHYYLLTYSYLEKKVYDIYLFGMLKILIDLYEHRDSFTGTELFELIKNYKVYVQDSREEEIAEYLSCFLASQIVYYNSIIIVNK